MFFREFQKPLLDFYAEARQRQIGILLGYSLKCKFCWKGFSGSKETSLLSAYSSLLEVLKLHFPPSRKFK